jgi:dethiobiotin synthetase
MPNGPRPALAVTGTDTGVGKTVTACALVAALRARGLDAAAMKPVETGVAESDPPGAMQATDAAALRRATGDRDAIERVCPIVYAEPLAPWGAARRSGRPLDLARLDAAFAGLASSADAIVVEGAGGLLVPFDRSLTFADLASRWGLALVVVAANRLGVLNHALLTVREAERRGLPVRAVALNTISGVAMNLAERTNAATLAELGAPVPVVALPPLADGARASLDALAAHGAALAARCVSPA